MLYAECKPDILLVRLLTGAPKRGAIHELKGKYELCKRLGGQTNCVALMDEDPQSQQPAYVRALMPDKALAKYDLKVLDDISSRNRVVLLCPRLEDWVLGGAREAALDVGKYSLPDDPRAFHRVVNLRLDGFERLVAELKDTPRFKALAGLLRGPARGSRARKSG